MGMGALAVGSDGGGSVRIPAALCGIVGMQASMGRVPLWPGCRDASQPGASGWESLEHIGPLGRCPADVALMLSVMAGPDDRDRWSLPDDGMDWQVESDRDLPGLRIASSPDLVFAAVEHFAQLGAEVERVDPGCGDLAAVLRTLVALETGLLGLRRLTAPRREDVSPQLLALLDHPWSAEDFTDAIALPAGFADGLPVGIQLIGRRLEDALVLRAAASFDAACGEGRPWPSAGAGSSPGLQVVVAA